MKYNLTEKLYSVKDLQELWKCSYSQAIQVMHAKGINPIKIGRKYLVEESQVIKYLESKRKYN